MAQIRKDLLHLAGEYRVCSELLKRNVFATITYGNHKAVDVYAIGDRKKKALRIEVKTSQLKRFVTGISQKGLDKSSDAPDFWVLCQMKAGDTGVIGERFFVLSHDEICREQARVNRRCAEEYEKKHGHPSTSTGGVDCVRLQYVEKYEDEWKKVVDAIG